MAKMFRLIIALVVLAGGCMFNSDTQFTADIDGTPFKATFAAWNDGSPTSSITASDIKILKPAASKVFFITVSGAFEEGIFPLGLKGAGAFAVYNDFSQEKAYVTSSGTLTITSKTEDGLTGTFDMILVETSPLPGGSTLEITNGAFDLPVASDPEM
jgi:hypothetical protein